MARPMRGYAMERLEAERERTGMDKKSLSRALGITSRTYWNYLTGGPIPSDKLIAMAQLFGCSTDYLLGLTDQRAGA